MYLMKYYIYTRETPAFGRISLALRGNDALAATFGKPPPLAVVKKKIEFDAFGASGAAESAAFGGDKKNGVPQAPQMV